MASSMTPKQEVMQRLGQLRRERATFFTHWQELTAYMLPRQGRYFLADHNKGWKRHNNIYDSTASRALKTLAAGLMGGLTSPARPWFRLQTANSDLNEQHDVKQWLSLVTRLMLSVFARSNTYRSLQASYLELGAFGTSASIVVEDYDRVIWHHQLTAGEYFIAQDWKGRVCTLYREFEKTVSEIVKEFGYANCSARVKSLYDTNQLDSWVPIIHAIEPREDRDQGKADNLNMPWRSIYFEVGGDRDKPLRESGFKHFPALCPRWDVAGGDIYGNSPGMECLGDVKQLQQQQLRKSQAIDYQTNPPLQVPTSMKNREIERLPGGITYVDAASQSAGIRTMFDVALDLGALREDIQDVRQRIESSFYSDLFLMLGNQTDTRMTATEVAERHEEKLLMLGPVLERLHNELLDPLITITFDRMLAAGMVPPPPMVLQGQDLNVELVSMLAQAQRAIATNGVDRFVQSMGGIAQLKPEVLDNFDVDQWATRYADMLGVDPEMLVDEKKVAATRMQRQQAQQQQAQQQAMESKANAAAKLGQVQTQGGNSNAMNDVMSYFSGYGSPVTPQPGT